MRKLVLLLFFFPLFLSAQQQYKVGCIGFYNFENLFDTLDAPDIRDEEFTPEGDNRYTAEIYREKQDRLASVVAELATDLTPDGLALLGVAEVENRSVLEDFVRHPKIRDRNYQIVHYDSPDERGIDVGLLYQPKYFTVTGSKAYPLLLYENDSTRNFTRDVLYVSGRFDDEPLHVLVNHWPSRSGGEARSQPLRNAAALLCKQICDSLLAIDAEARIVIMGDLNDDPISPSVKQILNAKRKVGQVKDGGFFNPMYDFFKKGMGTLAYRDAWSLFDQIIVSHALVREDQPGFRYLRAVIHNEPHLVQKSGHFKGYPYRTFGGGQYLGGYSDHFPVYVVLVKPVK